MTPYLSQRHLPMLSALSFTFQWQAIAVDDRQYKRGSLHYHTHPSHCIALVLGVGIVCGFISTYPNIISFKKAYK